MSSPSDRLARANLDADVQRLLEFRLHDPRLVLGLKSVDGDDVRVRVWLPNAERVELVARHAELARVPGTALFEWTGARDGLTAPYRIRWQARDGAWREQYDPYSFPLQIEEYDLARFAAAKGQPDKFHYTMTRAWLELVVDARRQSPGEPPPALLSRYPVLADGGALARFYSPDVLSSAAARAGWVPPDLGPLRVAGDIMAAGSR